MNNKFTAQLHVDFDNTCNFLQKNVRSDLTKSSFIGSLQTADPEE